MYSNIRVHISSRLGTWSRAAWFYASVALAPAPGGATVAGRVEDAGGKPVADADVLLRPGHATTRSGADGRFAFRDVSPGNYRVAVRMLGYAPDHWDVVVKDTVAKEIKFVLSRAKELPAVEVTAQAKCSTRTLDGFFCRRAAKLGGRFLDDADIDDLMPRSIADVLASVPEFRVETRSTRRGQIRVAVPVRAYSCVRSIVDGLPASAANPVPELPIDVAAMEIYMHPDSVPAAYQRFTWPAQVSRSGRCAIIVYWTVASP